MGMSNIDRMVDAIVRDEMNYVKMLNGNELHLYVEGLIRDKIELDFTDAQIIEAYEALGD